MMLSLRCYQVMMIAYGWTLMLTLPSPHFYPAFVGVVESREESVWHQLQDHNTASHFKRQQQQQQQQQQQKNDGDQIYNFPLLFVDVDMKSAGVAPSSPSSSSGVPTISTTRKDDRNMQMMMSNMMTLTKTKAPTSVPATTTTSQRPTVLTAPSSKESKMITSKMMMTMLTPSPTVSAEPTYLESLYPTPTTTVGKGMSSKKDPKGTYPTSSSLSPSVSAEPTYLDDDDLDVNSGKGMSSMSMVIDDRKGKGGPTSPSPSVSSEPTYIESSSFYPTSSNGKGGMMMMSSSDDKMGKTTPSPSVSSEPTYMESYFPTSSNGKEGMMMSKMSKEVPTVSPSISLVPSITAVPTFGGGGRMMMGMKMGMDDKNNNKNENMMMKKGKGGMSMSKITLPPSPTTTVPTTPPNVVLVPTNAPSPAPLDDNRVTLSPYTLRYVFNQTSVPRTFEIEEVVAVTRMYLAEYFEIRYTDITEFITNMTGNMFTLQQPFLINYTSVAVFDNSVDAVLPPVEELDIVLIAAFTTTNLVNYITLLQDLPPENIFRTTTNVTFTIDPVTDNSTLRTKDDDGSSSDNNGSRHSAKVAAGIATATGVFMMALIAVLVTRRHRNNRKKLKPTDDHDVPLNKRHMNQNSPDDEGHMTVAGDTYLAESTVVSGGTSSILSSSSASRQKRFKSRRILSQSRELALMPKPSSNGMQFLALPQLPPPALNRGSSNDHYDDEDDQASDHEIYENDDFANDDDRRLLPFYTSTPEPAYRGALTVDVNERRPGGGAAAPEDVLLPPQQQKQKQQQQYDDHIPNEMLWHHDIADNNDDDDTLSVDDDVPLRVIDLIRKFTPGKRRHSNKSR